MKTRSILILITFLMATFTMGHAQQTGSFNTSLTFMGQSRTLSCHVPSSYDSTQSYQLMVCLHGLGDDSNNFRNALINSLDWPTVFPNTIFVCPDGGDDTNSDFYTPIGDEGIVDESIDFAFQNYNIDTANVILEGFSLGGRSALKYGLDFPQKFKGLLLNTPAIQGLADAVNDTAIAFGFDYSNAPEIPIYVTMGGDDVLYVYSYETVHKQLKKNDGVVKYVEIAGMGHTVPATSYTSPSLAFFENPASAPYDIDLFELEVDDRYCDANVQAGCYVQNLGSDTVTSIDIDYSTNGVSGTYTWTGNLGLYQHAQINLPLMNLSNGDYNLELSIGAININHTDSLADNNQLSDSIYVALEGEPYPLFQGFEDNFNGWLFPETGSLFAWYQDDDVSHTGQSSMAAFNTILIFYTLAYEESFISPVMDLTTTATPKISFDLAYNYHKYTPPYFTADVLFADTLEISISTDCGYTWETLFKKGGADLATAQNPIVNPLSIQDCFFSPNSNEWSQNIIDLGPYASATRAEIKFSYISALGGSIYIDNVHFNADPYEIEVTETQGFNMYPNPASTILNIEMEDQLYSLVNIYDVSGRIVSTSELNSINAQLDISMLTDGFYTVELFGSDSKVSKKLMVKQ